VDAPWVPWLWVGIGVVYLALAYLAAAVWAAPAWTTALVVLIALVFFAGAALFWHASARGKFLVWRGLLADLPAPAQVLDLGCGRGAVSIMTAQAFPDARIVGVDLWRSVDQSGNSPAAAEANALENGVADRIRFVTGDMTSLPDFEHMFDLATASLSIHNIRTADARAKAIDEAWRVLSPGGHLVIVDISKVDEYVARLRTLGATDLFIRDGGWGLWWTGPWMATRILVAAKAA
jgi:SAM-dependent methyltransferase